MVVLGIHGGLTIRQHEPSAALIVDGKVVAACEEERYLRMKDCYGRMPTAAIQACLDKAGLTMNDVDLVVSPGITYNQFAESISLYLKHEFGHAPRLERVHHQEAHMAAAFYSSGCDDAICVALDNSGDGACGMIAAASKKDGLRVLKEIPNTNSLGMFYTLMTYYLGYSDGDEYKVMGLAPYGKPDIDLSAVARPVPGGWEFNRSLVRSSPPLQSPFEPVYTEELERLLGQPHRQPGAELTQFHRDIAASTQAALEKCIFNMLDDLTRTEQHSRNLCMAGGVAMNCVANGKILMSGKFDRMFVPPAASDRGLALGCAYLGSAMLGDRPGPFPSPGLGDEYSDADILKELKGNGIPFREVSDPSEEAARLIAADQIIGWHQGRSEFGARALGFRSILSKPGGIQFKETVNAKIKYREDFRPFAPAVASDRAEETFVTRGADSPYMAFTFNAKNPAMDALGAVVHVDGSARLQTVKQSENEPFYKLLTELGRMTGLPVVLNTSFNLKGQPIVETPRDALMTFFGCGLDHLVVGRFVVSKR